MAKASEEQQQSSLIWLLLLGGGAYLLWRYTQKQKKLREGLAARAGAVSAGSGGGSSAWSGSTPSFPVSTGSGDGATEINISTGGGSG